jgi:pyridoxal phosphate enzyme (YggS family)
VEPGISSLIQIRYEQVCEKIANAAHISGRQPESVRLIVVTKTHGIEIVRAALETGIRDLGENYAEEAQEKIKFIGLVQDLKWHMIGHVQSRKAAVVAQNFDFVHSIDSLKLANRLDRFAGEAGRKLKILLECNLSEEDSKSGYPAYNQDNYEKIYEDAEQISRFSNLDIRGLMTMPPLYTDPEKTRPYFRKLRELREYLSRRLPQIYWNELSMGTSTDYVVAIEEGATFVRVGTAILGARKPRN